MSLLTKKPSTHTTLNNLHSTPQQINIPSEVKSSPSSRPDQQNALALTLNALLKEAVSILPQRAMNDIQGPLHLHRSDKAQFKKIVPYDASEIRQHTVNTEYRTGVTCPKTDAKADDK